MKKLSILLLLISTMLNFAQLQAQITLDFDKERDWWFEYQTTTQIYDTNTDTTEVIEFKKPSEWEAIYISIFLASQDADSCCEWIKLEGGYENDWDGSYWTTVDGPDTVTTANYGINEIQFTIQTSDKAYPYYRMIIGGSTDQTDHSTNITKLWFMYTYNWEK